MNLGNALGNALIGNTDPNSDPLAVSTGLGEGQAQVFKPYTGEAYQKAAELRQRQQQLDQEAQRKRQAQEGDKANLLASLNKLSKYRPQEFGNVKLRHDKIVNKILSLNQDSPSYAQDLAEVQNGISSLGEIVHASNDIPNAYGKANEVINSGKYWIPKEDLAKIKADHDEKYGIIDDDEALLDKLASKAANAELFANAEPLIKDQNAALTDIAQSVTVPKETGKTVLDPVSGQYVREVIRVTDPVKLEQVGKDIYKRSKQWQSYIPSEDEFLAQLRARTVDKSTESAKYQPTASATSGMAGEKNKKVNATYRFDESGNIVGSDLMGTTGNDTKLATVDIEGSPSQVIVVGTEGDKVKVLVPKNEKAVLDWYAERTKRLNAEQKHKLDLEKQYDEGKISERQKSDAIIAWHKANPVKPFPEENSKVMLLDKDNGGEAALHQTFGVTLDQVNSGKVPAFVREDKSLKGKASNQPQTTKIGDSKEAPIIITKGIKFEKGKWYKGKNGEVKQYN